MSRLAQLVRYSSKVYDFLSLLKRVRDSRDKIRTQIPTPAVILAWFIAFCARVQSREQIGRYLDRKGVQKLVGCHISSDTLGRVLSQLDADSIRTEVLIPLIRQMRRNKAWQKGTVAGQVLIGIDGSEAFSSRRQHCPACQVRVLSGELGNEYYHRAVWAFIIGTEPKVYLDVEPLQKEEGEVTAATRLVSRLARYYGRWIDGVVVDAGFAGAPFLNHVRKNGFHYIVRVKQENRHMIKEVQSIVSKRVPDTSWQQRIGHRRLQIDAWDQDVLRWSWHGLDAHPRVVVSNELELGEAPSRRRQVPQSERRRSSAFLVTSYPKQVLSTQEVCLGYHRRWDIENSGMRQLKHEWHWDHPFVHTPEALHALWLLLAVAANLFVAFVDRRLPTTRSGSTPDRFIAEEIAADLLHLTAATVPSWNSS
jgi:hypothetical protein